MIHKKPRKTKKPSAPKEAFFEILRYGFFLLYVAGLGGVLWLAHSARKGPAPLPPQTPEFENESAVMETLEIQQEVLKEEEAPVISETAPPAEGPEIEHASVL